MRAVPSVETSYGKLCAETVGLSTIPDQFSRQAIGQGFVLNLLVLGRRGSGASTLVNALFRAPLVQKERSDEVTTTCNEIVEEGVRLSVSVTTYHGDEHAAAIRFIEGRYKEYYENEQSLVGRNTDRRVHACLYLLPSDKLSNAELRAIKAISQLCNLIPVITKADVYTNRELVLRKEVVAGLLCEHGIAGFKYNKRLIEDVDDVPGIIDMQGTSELVPLSSEASLPQLTDGKEDVRLLATIASERLYDYQGKIIRGRRYPWGFVDIENESISDFLALQRILLHVHYEDLLHRTDVVYYQQYRTEARAKEKASAENDEEVLRLRLGRLQTQIEEILDRKHEEVLERLAKEEEVLSRSLPAPSADANNESAEEK
ncbi:hypothetical protein PAPHI01_1058 [Pancytospora philotis]|nr:hypothetical protein PAPHI01_1058 [Pancytospora philotis]